MILLKRKISPYVEASAEKYPILALMGPRQSGKTTLVKKLFSDKPYVSLEDPDLRYFATNDPRAFLAKYQEGAILDEIQRAPDLMSYLQTMVDDNPKPGRFILTGSHQLMLHQAITQSLAGRVSLITLLPFSLEEVKNIHPDWSLDDYMFHGFYPRIYQNELNPTEAYRNYVKTYIERDLRLIINVKDLLVFERFLKVCAGRTGQLINYAALANEVGVSATTIREWLSILEASFIIKLLPPYFENFGKRVSKSPKLYFIDVGLAVYLLDIQVASQLSRDPLRGSLVENLVIIEVLKFYLNRGVEPSLFFYRENNGAEIDLLLKQANQLVPFEIKASQTFHHGFLKHLDWFKKLLADRVDQSFLVYDGLFLKTSVNISIINWKTVDEILPFYSA